jgi:Zn-finger nucleic acid-binding protein
MKCPSCADSILVMSDRQGVEIDYCPACRGIWLDRGELDKLLERSATTPAPPPAAQVAQGRKQPDFEDSDFRNGQRQGQHQGQHRKKSWLNDIFD